MTKWVYGFGGGKAEGGAAMRALLGGKGANLAEMASLGLPVPPGFTINTEVCAYFSANEKAFPAGLDAEVKAALARMEQAVNVQAMVFGNMGDTSATGVFFTRNPSTSDNHFYGEFLVNAQGEDVVAGVRTPQSLTRAEREAGGSKLPSMEKAMPHAFAELCEVCERL